MIIKKGIEVRTIYLLLLLLAYPLLGQIEVKNHPKEFGWVDIYSEAGGFKQLITRDTTSTFPIKDIRGAHTLWLRLQHVTTSDSLLRVELELYNSKLDDDGDATDDDGGWGVYYDGTASDSHLFDVVAGEIGATAADLYISLPKYSEKEWAWADRGRFIFVVGNGDTTNVQAYVGGQ